MSDAKLYTRTDCHYTQHGLTEPAWRRVLATVEALERVTRERDEARAALRDVAERQREACAAYLARVCNDYGIEPDCLCSPADETVLATPLVTDKESK